MARLWERVAPDEVHRPINGVWQRKGMTCSEKKENWSAIGLWVGCPQSFSSPSCSSFQGILHRSSSGSESIWYVPGARDQHLGVTDLEDSRFNPLLVVLFKGLTLPPGTFEPNQSCIVRWIFFFPLPPSLFPSPSSSSFIAL